MIDTGLFRSEAVGAAENSSRWDLGSGAASGMTFASEGENGRSLRIGAAVSTIVNTLVPKRRQQSAELRFKYEGNASYFEQVQADSPILYARLGETVGNFADSGSSGIAGSLVGSATRGVGSIVDGGSNAVHLAHTGTNYINFGDAAAFTTANGTAIAWAKLDALPTGAERHWFFSKWASGGGFIIEAISTGWRAFVSNGTSTATLTSNANFTTGIHQLGITWDGTDAKLYVDGVLRHTQPAAFNMPDNGNNLAVGGWIVANFGAGGVVDEVSLHGTPLSGTRIGVLYDTGVGNGIPLATVAWSGVVCRYTSLSDYVMLRASHVTTKAAELVEKIGGVATVLGTIPYVGSTSGYGAVRLEVVGRRARCWYQSDGFDEVDDRPPDAAFNLKREYGASNLVGNWGVYLEANAVNTIKGLRFLAREMPDHVPLPPFLRVEAAPAYNFDCILLTAPSGSGLSEWELQPLDPDDFAEGFEQFGPASSLKVYGRSGHKYLARHRYRAADRIRTATAWVEGTVTAAGSKVAPVPPTLPPDYFPTTNYKGEPLIPDYQLVYESDAAVESMPTEDGHADHTAQFPRGRRFVRVRYENRLPVDIQPLIDFFNDMKAGATKFTWTHPISQEQIAVAFHQDQARPEHVRTTSQGTMMSLQLEMVETGYGVLTPIGPTLTLDRNI